MLVIAGVMSTGGATAQTGSPTNNLYFNTQYGSGKYTNAQYDGYYSFQDFYDALTPYGQWIDDKQYGYVWSPAVESNFRPYYTNGHWLATDYGNTWVSEYPWGWACFHYGRWTFDSYYGWLWVPGSNWGPAWVSWKNANGHFGWAPLAPGYEVSNTEAAKYTCPKDWWVFIPYQYMYSSNYYRFWTGPLGNSLMLKDATIADNNFNHSGVMMVAGPNVKQVELASGKTPVVHKLANTGMPKVDYVHLDVIKMYRPQEIKQLNQNGEKIVCAAAITAPRPVAPKPQAMNTITTTMVPFRTDLPDILTRATKVIVPSQSVYNKRNEPQTKEAERADKTQYYSDLKAQEPTRPRPKPLVKKEEAPLPEQQPQTPEAVPMPKKKDAPPSPNRQHADPVPAMPAPANAPQAPLPAQRPEPVQPK